MKKSFWIGALTCTWAACAHTTSTQATPEPPAAPSGKDRTVGLHLSCTSSNQCQMGQECIPFSDNAGEAGVCEIPCLKTEECPQGFFCGHNAVNSSTDVCYRRPAVEPKPAPTSPSPKDSDSGLGQ